MKAIVTLLGKVKACYDFGGQKGIKSSTYSAPLCNPDSIPCVKTVILEETKPIHHHLCCNNYILNSTFYPSLSASNRKSSQRPMIVLITPVSLFQTPVRCFGRFLLPLSLLLLASRECRVTSPAVLISHVQHTMTCAILLMHPAVLTIGTINPPAISGSLPARTMMVEHGFV